MKYVKKLREKNVIKSQAGTEKKVSIISVNYNQPLVTEALLQSIFETNTYPNLEIIIVDNGSKVNPTDRWTAKYPEVIFLSSEINLGFAGGNNLGIQASNGDFVFLVNNDTEFTIGLIEKLLITFEDFPDTGIVCPKINYFDQKELIQYLGYTELHPITARNKCIGQYEIDKGQFDHQIYATAFAHGAAMMVSRVAIDKVGLMEEGFFLYYEEFDWCLRFRENGYKIRVNSHVKIFHKESISVGTDSALKNYYMTRNRILVMRRHTGLMHFCLFSLYFAFVVFPRNLLDYLLKGRFDKIRAMLRAIGWNFTHSSKMLSTQY